MIGCKKCFGIEHERQLDGSPIFGKMRLWLEGRYIGAFDDVNILSVAWHQLDGLNVDDIDGCRFGNMPPEDIYGELESGAVDDFRRYILMPGEAFDEFLVYWYACNKKLHFVWKLVDRPFFSYPGYPSDVQFAQVPIAEFQRAVDEFGMVIRQHA